MIVEHCEATAVLDVKKGKNGHKLRYNEHFKILWLQIDKHGETNISWKNQLNPTSGLRDLFLTLKLNI